MTFHSLLMMQLGVIPEEQWHYDLNILKQKAQLDSHDLTPKDATIRTARRLAEILADFYRFLMFIVCPSLTVTWLSSVICAEPMIF